MFLWAEVIKVLAFCQMNQAFNLKSSMQAVYLLELNSLDLDQIYDKLQFIHKTTPNLIVSAPVVLNLEHVENQVEKAFLFELLTILKGFSMNPIAVQTSIKEIQAWLKKADIASQKITKKPRQALEPKPIEELGTLMIEKMQQSSIYAQNQHVMVLGDVPKDFEIMADGNITIMGKLQGKAISGAKGRKNTQVFCNKCEAQSISVGQTCINPALIPILEEPCHFFIQGNQVEYAVFFREERE